MGAGVPHWVLTSVDHLQGTCEFHISRNISYSPEKHDLLGEAQLTLFLQEHLAQCCQ